MTVHFNVPRWFINMYSAVVPGNEYDYTDTPQFRWGNLYFFSEKLYQSVSFIYASMYREKVQAIHAVCKKNRVIV